MGRMVGFTKSLGDRLISQQTIQYDAAGKIVQFSITDDYDSPIEYTPEYNEQGDLIKETCMHEEGFGSVTEYGYDAEGHVIMKKSYDCYAEDFVFDEGCYTFCEDSLHYTYDEGNRVKSIDEVITQDGSEQWHSDCDSLGSVISHRLVDFDYCQTYSFKYKLDERGNWIERESISSDGSTNITMREIIYQ
jgi:YD repeat-containing protein